ELRVEHVGAVGGVAHDLHHLRVARPLVSERLLERGLHRWDRKPGAAHAGRLQDLDACRDLERPPGSRPWREFFLLGAGGCREAREVRRGGRRGERCRGAQEAASIHGAISSGCVLLLLMALDDIGIRREGKSITPIAGRPVLGGCRKGAGGGYAWLGTAGS